MTTHDQSEVSKFLAAIADRVDLYSHSQLAFVAIGTPSGFVLHHAQVTLVGDWWLSTAKRGVLETDRVIAGSLSLAEAGLTLESLLTSLAVGKIRICGHELTFPLDEASGMSAFFMQLDPDAAAVQRNGAKLILSGRMSTATPTRSHIDWHLRAHSFDSLDDLCASFGIGATDLARPIVEVKATNVAEVHASSIVSEGTCALAIGIPKGADRSRAHIAYRVFSSSAKNQRETVTGDAMTWTKGPNVAVGKFEIDVPKGAAVQCFACYAGIAQHAHWIGDPKYAPNLRRLIFEGVDPGLEVAQDFLFETKRQRKESRDFEAGVAWLLWMAGFSVLHPGTKRLEDNADLIALTPTSKLLVIECTTGLLSKEGKLSLLQHRVAALRKRLAAGGFAHLPVLAVGITTRPRDEIAADIQEAAKAGVLLLAADDLRRGVDRTLAPLDPEDLFAEGVEAMQRLATADAKH